MIVVDTSVAVKWLFPEADFAGAAFALLEAELSMDEPILGPPLLYSEVTNVIRRRQFRANVPRERALSLLKQFMAIPIAIVEPDNLHRRALVFANDFDLPATDDAHFMALAEAYGCHLWTDDQRLLRQLNGRLPFVRWIGTYGN
jgi:predicted nucleic acid-binding protein